MITPAVAQQDLARHGLQLARYAKAPALCDRRSCSTLVSWGGPLPVCLAAGAKTDVVLVVLPTSRDARTIVRRIFGILPR